MAASLATPWRDNKLVYGRISRALHWGMAMLFAWQFAGVGFRALGILEPLAKLIASTHGATGTLLLALVLLRGAWGLAHLRRRPAPPAHGPRRLATLGHLALYGLMLAVPALALLRTYGMGRAFAPFGIPLFAGFEGRIGWMTAPANALHGLLGWTLLALIAGHVVMAVAHRVFWQDDVLVRMAGSAAPAAAHHPETVSR